MYYKERNFTNDGLKSTSLKTETNLPIHLNKNEKIVDR